MAAPSDGGTNSPQASWDAQVVIDLPPAGNLPATATAVINGLVGYVMCSGGSGYTATPAVMITGGGGFGATATAVMWGGAILGMNITNPGSDYYEIAVVQYREQMHADLNQTDLRGYVQIENPGVVGKVGCTAHYALLYPPVPPATTGLLILNAQTGLPVFACDKP